MYTDENTIKARDVKKLLMRVYRRYQAGNITEKQAHKETYILNSLMKAIETTDLEDRLDNIENILRTK